MWKWRSFWIKDPTQLETCFFKGYINWYEMPSETTVPAGQGQKTHPDDCVWVWNERLAGVSCCQDHREPSRKTFPPPLRQNNFSRCSEQFLDVSYIWRFGRDAEFCCQAARRLRLQFRPTISIQNQHLHWFALNYTVPHFSVPESFDTLHSIEFHFSRLLQQGFPRFEPTFIQLDYLWKVILIQNSICFRGEVDQQREIWRILKDLRRLQRG